MPVAQSPEAKERKSCNQIQATILAAVGSEKATHPTQPDAGIFGRIPPQIKGGNFPIRSKSPADSKSNSMHSPEKARKCVCFLLSLPGSAQFENDWLAQRIEGLPFKWWEQRETGNNGSKCLEGRVKLCSHKLFGLFPAIFLGNSGWTHRAAFISQL